MFLWRVEMVMLRSVTVPTETCGGLVQALGFVAVSGDDNVGTVLGLHSAVLKCGSVSIAVRLSIRRSAATYLALSFATRFLNKFLIQASDYSKPHGLLPFATGLFYPRV
jgi:hypothetical protein